MDDEFRSFPGPESLAIQAFLEGFEEAFRAPARKALSAAGVIRRACSDMLEEVQNALISKSIYDIDYQYEKSQHTR